MSVREKQNANLIPGGHPDAHVFTREEHQRGAQASAKSRQERKSFAQLTALALASNAPEDLKEGLERIGIKGEDQTGAAVVVAGVFGKAAKGDADAVKQLETWAGSIVQQSDADLADACAISERNYYRNIGKAFYGLSGQIMGHAATHFDLSGGRGSLKSSMISLIVPRIIMTHKDTHALVLRKVGNTIRDSVYAQYLWAIGQLGVADYWEAKKTPMELIFKPTGQKIMFRGADDPMKIKSIKVPFGYIAITHFEEKDQFAGRREIRTILQSTMRGGAEFWNFESYNPPISRDNWANKDSLEERADRIAHKSTYLDVQNVDWLGEQFLNEAEHLKATNEKAYRHEYLGEPVGTGGNVFENIEVRTITDEEIERFDRIYQGVDFGWYPDQYAFLRMYYNSNQETIYLIDELYVNKWSNAQTGEWIKQKGYDDYVIICDSAEPKSVNDYKDMGLPARGAVKGPGSVDYGFKWLQSRKIVIDPKRTPAAHEEIISYEYERDKDGNIISGYPDANDHAISALRYAMEPLFNRRGASA